MNLPWGYVVFLVALLLAGLYTLSQVPPYWRGSFPARVESAIGAASLEGLKMRAIVRLTLPSSIWFIVFSVSLLVNGFVEPRSVMRDITIGLAIAACFVSLPLMVTLVFFNRPKRLVPPRLRDGPGVHEDPHG